MHVGSDDEVHLVLEEKILDAITQVSGKRIAVLFNHEMSITQLPCSCQSSDLARVRHAVEGAVASDHDPRHFGAVGVCLLEVSL